MMAAARNELQDDQRYMAQALMLAQRGLGATMPNPSVGALIVEGAGAAAEIVGRGWTQAGGRPHGEVDALRRAGDKASGATLYVTLEPCSHHGKTPPCADAVIAAGIARVVIGTGDPDTRVAGRGIARLLDAGIEVVVGVLADEARWVSAGHILRIRAKRPFVQLKLAVSADGRIAAGTGKPVWVTGVTARARGSLLRAQADAILVGRGTVAADDPELTCRLPGLEVRSPIRVVLDSDLAIAADAALVTSAKVTPTILMSAAPDVQTDARSGSRPSTDAATSKRDALTKAGVQLLEVQREAGGSGGALGLDPAAVLAQLADLGVTRLLIEGGPRVGRSFLDAGLVDEAVIFRGRAALGDSGLLPLWDRGLAEFSEGARWKLTDERRLSAARLDGSHLDGSHPDGSRPDGFRPDGFRPDGPHLDGDHMSIYQNQATVSMLQDPT